MSGEASYTPYHPRWYRRRVSVWWWLESWRYAKFVTREITSLAVAFFALVALLKVRALSAGPEAYAEFLALMKRPLFLVLNSLALLLILFHAVTWFKLAPKAMVVRFGGKRVPDSVITGLNYLAWFAVSGAVVWVLLRGRS